MSCWGRAVLSRDRVRLHGGSVFATASSTRELASGPTRRTWRRCWGIPTASDCSKTIVCVFVVSRPRRHASPASARRLGSWEIGALHHACIMMPGCHGDGGTVRGSRYQHRLVVRGRMTEIIAFAVMHQFVACAHKIRCADQLILKLAGSYTVARSLAGRREILLAPTRCGLIQGWLWPAQPSFLACRTQSCSG
jgi:hypothetical protein